MSRLEEVNKTMKTMEKLNDAVTRLGECILNDKKITNINLANLVTILGDISISMAMIVDRLTESEDKE